MIKAIIYDCFGVLYPNASNLFYARHQEVFGKDTEFLDNLNLNIDLGKINRSEFFQQLSDHIDIPAGQIQSEFDAALIVDQQVREFIKHTKSIYKTALLTNAGSGELDVFYRDKSDQLFEVMTVSHEVGTVKPNELIYKKCLEDLAVQPNECIFVDDSLVNLTSAERLGIATIHYKDFEQFKAELSKLTGKNWGEL